MKIKLLLKNETRETSLWLKISLHKEKQKEESLMLIYVMTLGESFSLEEFLEKIIQLGWFGTPTSSSLSLLLELGIEQSVVYNGSWIKMTLNKNWVSKIILTTKLFFWTFCEKILISLIIMKSYCSQLNKLIVFYFHKASDIFLSTISYWSSASRMDMCMSLFNGSPYNSNT